jgi:phasin
MQAHQSQEEDMARNPTSPIPGVPQEVRQMMETSIAQAKQAVEQYMTAAHKALGAAQSSAQAAQAGARDINEKAIDFAQANVKAAFDFTERLAEARDLQQIAELQKQFLQAQTEKMTAQMKELGGIASRTAGEAMKPRS